MKKLLLMLGIAIASYCSFAQTAIPPILYNSTTQVISSQPASAIQDGHLLSTDWNIFNNKQPALTFSTGLNNTSNSITVNPSQNISTLSNLTSNGLIKTSGGTGALSIATAGTDYQVPITSGPVTVSSGVSSLGKNIALNSGTASSWNSIYNSIDVNATNGNSLFSTTSTTTTVGGNGTGLTYNSYISGTNAALTHVNYGNAGSIYVSKKGFYYKTSPYGASGTTPTTKDVFTVDTLGNTFYNGTIVAQTPMGATTDSVVVKLNTTKKFGTRPATAFVANPLTTTGDIIYSSNGLTPSRLGIGSTGQILTVSGGLPTWSSNINANLGIGTATPAAKLDVTGTAMLGGSSAANLDPGAGSISYIENTGKVLIGWNRSASEGETDFIGNQGIGTAGGFAFYNHDNSGTEKQLMRIMGNGAIGIGVAYPDAKLAVNGTIHTKEIKVDLNGWSDYVFEPTYSLPSLASVKNYINENHHLPEMPSTQEVLKNGVNVGEMLSLQTKKVEELTLYLIEKDKQLTQQNKQLNEQGKTNQLLQTTLSQMEVRLKALETK